MAADGAAMRGLFTRIGFKAGAANVLFHDQDISSIAELEPLEDSDVDELVKAVRRPGGMNAAGDGPNLGLAVSLRAAKNLKLTCFALRHRQRVSRTTDPPAVTMDFLDRHRVLMASEAAHTEPDMDVTVDELDWPATIDAIVERLAEMRGETGIPLPYVIREDSEVIDEDEDPEDAYDDEQEHMIARAPHWKNGIPHPTFIADSRKVWTLLSALLHPTTAWSVIATCRSKRDGRAAFEALREHYLGPSHVSNMVDKSTLALQNSSYHGEKRNWNFEKLLQLHYHHHQILTNCVPDGEIGISERQKVRHLINAIKTDEVEVCVAMVEASTVLMQDFTAAARVFQNKIMRSSARAGKPSVKIAAARIRNGPQGDVGAKPDGVEDTYYTKAEYQKLSKAQQDWLRAARKARGHAPGNKSGGSPSKRRKTDASVQQINISTVAQAVARGVAEAAAASQPAKDADKDKDKAKTTNRNNDNLTRQ